MPKEVATKYTVPKENHIYIISASTQNKKNTLHLSYMLNPLPKLKRKRNRSPTPPPCPLTLLPTMDDILESRWMTYGRVASEGLVFREGVMAMEAFDPN